jgi:hypothetical protein
LCAQFAGSRDELTGYSPKAGHRSGSSQ